MVICRHVCRAILREHNCLPILLQQLKSPSLTVVSNACGTLWNLSARCPQDPVSYTHLDVYKRQEPYPIFGAKRLA